MVFDCTPQTAMGLLDGVEKWTIWWQHDHVESNQVVMYGTMGHGSSFNLSKVTNSKTQNL